MTSRFEIHKDDPAVGSEVSTWADGETYTLQVKQVSSDDKKATFEVVGVGEAPVEAEEEAEYEEELPVKSSKPKIKMDDVAKM
jgi:hypothetical protein